MGAGSRLRLSAPAPASVAQGFGKRFIKDEPTWATDYYPLSCKAKYAFCSARDFCLEFFFSPKPS